MKFKIKDQQLLAEAYEDMLLNEVSTTYIHSKLMNHKFDFPETRYTKARKNRIEHKLNQRVLNSKDLFNYNINNINYRAVVVKYEQKEDGYGPFIGYGFVYVPKEEGEEVGVGRVRFSLDTMDNLINFYVGKREAYFPTRADAVSFLRQINRIGEVYHAGGFDIPGEKLRPINILHLPIGGLH